MRPLLRLLPLTAILLLALTIGPANAQFYKYKDADGNIRFTDDLSQVPPEQRESAPGYREAEPETAQTPETPDPADPELPATGNPIMELEADRRELSERRQALETRFDEIQEEQERLRNKPKLTANPALVRRHNQEMAALRERIMEYEADRARYEAEVRAYNARLEAIQKEQTEAAAEEN
ncbi:MAG: DUF4124 domain-containing protein [Desulfococcaceae bacterium]